MCQTWRIGLALGVFAVIVSLRPEESRDQGTHDVLLRPDLRLLPFRAR